MNSSKKDYTAFEAIDFVQDDAFLQWVKYPQEEDIVFWEKWLAEHPHKREEIEEARRIITAVLEEEHYHLSTQDTEDIWERIEVSVDHVHYGRQKLPSWYYSVGAGMVLFIFFITGLIWYQRGDQHPANENYALGSQQIVKRFNKEEDTLNIVLSDGSTVCLEPGSSIRYPEVFEQDRREVILEGAGFFKITRDVDRPFFVYANEVVTKVLGTSFSVRAFQQEPDVTVEVRTGKVSVYRFNDVKIQPEAEAKRQGGVVLTPNQQAIYTKQEERLTKTLVARPIILPSKKALSFEFSDTPMREVFSVIEKAYGIEIIFDHQVMENCYLNASLNDESLQDKLSLICKAVNATYEVMDSHIIVYGKGCDD